MKNWFSKIVYTLLIGGIVWFSWGYFFPSEINRICKRLNSLAACLSFSSSGSYVMRMAAADSVRDFFSTNIVVNLDGVHARAEYISGRAEVMSILTTARTYLKEFNVKSGLISTVSLLYSIHLNILTTHLCLNPLSSQCVRDRIASALIRLIFLAFLCLCHVNGISTLKVFQGCAAQVV